MLREKEVTFHYSKLYSTVFWGFVFNAVNKQLFKIKKKDVISVHHAVRS